MHNRTKMFVACGAIFLFIGTLVFLYQRNDTVKTDFTTLVQESKRAAYEIERADYEAALIDVNGGISPEEVLRLYSEAVISGDYELASKYFIAEKQSVELLSLQQAEKLKLHTYLEFIKQRTQKVCNDEQCTLSIELEGPDYFMRFKKYPNQLWKIVEL